MYFYFNRHDKRKTLFRMFVYFSIGDFDLSWTPLSVPLFNALSQVPTIRDETLWLISRLCSLCCHDADHSQLSHAVYVVYKECHSPNYNVFCASIKHSCLVTTKLLCFSPCLSLFYVFIAVFYKILGPDRRFVLRGGIDACDSDVRDRIGRISSRRSSLCYNRISCSDNRDARNAEKRGLGVGNKRLICNVELGLT